MLPLPLTLRASGMCACTHDCMHACTKVNRRNVERKERIPLARFQWGQTASGDCAGWLDGRCYGD